MRWYVVITGAITTFNDIIPFGLEFVCVGDASVVQTTLVDRATGAEGFHLLVARQRHAGL